MKRPEFESLGLARVALFELELYNKLRKELDRGGKRISFYNISFILHVKVIQLLPFMNNLVNHTPLCLGSAEAWEVARGLSDLHR
jgi:hypothetical protein